MGAKLPSPCIDVCKFKREGHCIGCSMTKDQKKQSKKVNGKKRAEFVSKIVKQQRDLGKYGHWEIAYAKKCAKKDVRWPPK